MDGRVFYSDKGSKFNDCAKELQCNLLTDDFDWKAH